MRHDDSHYRGRYTLVLLVTLLKTKRKEGKKKVNVMAHDGFLSVFFFPPLSLSHLLSFNRFTSGI